MFTRSITHRIPLQLRQLRQGIVLVRASNDTVVDEYGTTITVEALMRDWLPAFLQHRTISLQHNLPELRGIRGKPFVGLARRVDFAPQLEVEVEVLDPETRALVEAGRITGASLEFVPLESRTQVVAGTESEVYYRLASEPELAGLTLTDLLGLDIDDSRNLQVDTPSWLGCCTCLARTSWGAFMTHRAPLLQTLQQSKKLSLAIAPKQKRATTEPPF
ncbi:MAG: hypothetical protein KatS3mg074_647 [Meiothermus sp.]|nr:MAG: hypothetical protein KatS3mg074_647 [Meiothermus sp.]